MTSLGINFLTLYALIVIISHGIDVIYEQSDSVSFNIA